MQVADSAIAQPGRAARHSLPRPADRSAIARSGCDATSRPGRSAGRGLVRVPGQHRPARLRPFHGRQGQQRRRRQQLVAGQRLGHCLPSFAQCPEPATRVRQNLNCEEESQFRRMPALLSPHRASNRRASCSVARTRLGQLVIRSSKCRHSGSVKDAASVCSGCWWMAGAHRPGSSRSIAVGR